MRIAILTPFYPYRGGIAQFSDRFYQELIKENEVKVFSYCTLYPSFLFPGTTQFVPKPIPDPKYPSERLLSSINPLTFGTTAKEINKYSPDVLFIAYWMPYVALALSGVCSKLDERIKIIGLVHNAIPHEKSILNKPLAMRFFKKCNAFICMSTSVEEDLKRLNLSMPILTLEHPIYDHYGERSDRQIAQKKLGLARNRKTLLFFGLIRAYKGLDLLISAMNKLDSSYQLIIAGEAYSDFRSYQELIDLSKNKENIKVWNQYISDQEVSLFFSAADVLILPYRSATQSGVVAVAYQLETPIIATDVGALGTAVKKGKTGIVIEGADSDLIAKGIKTFFDSKDQEFYLDNIKKERVRLSWSNYTKSVELFISKLSGN